MPQTFRSILVGENGTPEAARAVALAVSLAVCYRATLVILGVVTGLTAEQQAEGVGLEKTAHHAERLRAQIESAAEKARAQGVDAVTDILVGEMPRALEQFVRTHKVDLLVVGHHDKSPLRRLLEGSTPDRLAHDLELSLLIVHGGPAEE
jgi:nucleotide-binding universal stress UspA family protein